MVATTKSKITMPGLIIIEAPSNLGLIEPLPSKEPGVKKLPSCLNSNGFYHSLMPENVIEVKPPRYAMQYDKEAGVRNADTIVKYSKQLAKVVAEELKKEHFLLVIGGDCSILIGNSIALRSIGNYGLFFLDGHTDFCLPEHNLSTSAAGMDLAIVTGNGHDKLTNILNLKPYITEENVFCVGNREYVHPVEEIIAQSKIHYFNLKTVRETGIKKIINDFLLMIEEKNLNGFWIHFDVDVLNDDIMPCVDSRAEDGLTYQELAQILKPLLKSDKAAGIEITIFDPTLDKSGKIAKEFSNKLSEILK